ncbi:LPS export ABC transporter periplasmic protein LptC [Thiocystis minor]|uniref:LPS export ABC transporter periplasmic protein LptC n=1 Tax=Thiocystis minor TaxID=61597 RepID=UPI0019147366|nr:LPS export ABC transporter periplasmic protein LptC [Thiocystis minor]MBK5962850.1 LPS export ABC transporter periplasmic protein LptC [Thiocystis minor]
MSAHASLFGRPLWSRQQWLLAACFTVSGLVAWWQLQSRPDEAPASNPRPRLPDYVVLNFSAVETDEAGQPSRRLLADELRHFLDEDRSELERPRMNLFQPDGPPWKVRAQEGLVLAGGDQVRLVGDVRLDREGDGQTRPAQLETEQIDIWRKRSLAETDRPIRIRSDGDLLTANGMRLWYTDPTRTTFHGRARIRLAPETAPAREAPP